MPELLSKEEVESQTGAGIRANPGVRRRMDSFRGPRTTAATGKEGNHPTRDIGSQTMIFAWGCNSYWFSIVFVAATAAAGAAAVRQELQKRKKQDLRCSLVKLGTPSKLIQLVFYLPPAEKNKLTRCTLPFDTVCRLAANAPSINLQWILDLVLPALHLRLIDCQVDERVGVGVEVRACCDPCARQWQGKCNYSEYELM